ncbi:MAG: hypothetical protein ACRD5M_14330 [Candidatus Acidiferrales bacterium]
MNLPARIRRGIISALGITALLALPSIALATAAGDAPTITFRKVFKSSYPEFVEIKLNQSGSGTYDIRQLDDDASPAPFQIGPALAQRIFDLAARLHNFQGLDLDVHRRIANLGEKTFRYEKGGVTNEVRFNYTLEDSATQLLNIFEGITRQESDLSNLQRAMRYDHLGVNDAVHQLESDYNEKMIPEPDRLLPSLDRVASDNIYVDIARQRARALATRIRAAH